MATSEGSLTPTTNPNLMALSSLIIPGLGQFLLKRRWQGGIIFLTTAILGFLINWSLVNQEIGTVSLGGLTTSWLWLPLVILWIWNVLDARALASGSSISSLPGIILAVLILYIIAWNVTDVKLDRLVKNVGDARTIVLNLLNPDMITMNVNGKDQICAWSCMYEYVGDKLAGRPPAGTIRLSDDLMTILGEVKSIDAPKWLTGLGLAPQGAKVNSFIAGTLLETIAMGLMATIFSTILALPISFLAAHNIMSRIPGGNLIYFGVRSILNIVRAVDPLVWGLIVIVWVGIGTLCRRHGVDHPFCGGPGKALLRRNRAHRPRAGRSHHGHRRQPGPDHPLRRNSTDHSPLPGLYALTLGH